MQTDVVIALAVGLILIFVMTILYIKGEMGHLRTLGRVLGILGGAAAFVGAVIE